MDLFDASDYDFLVPRRARRVIAWALVAGIAFVPPVQRWYLGQIEHHAQHITRDLLSQFIETSEPEPRDSNDRPTGYR